MADSLFTWWILQAEKPAHQWLNRWVQMNLLFKQRGAGREKNKCIRLKLAKNTCVAPGAALRRVCDRAQQVNVCNVFIVSDLSVFPYCPPQ